jgi:predicted O-methyltransferase YrrM
MIFSRLPLLQKLKQEGILRKIPNISESSGMLLYTLIVLLERKNVLEIGCANGYSSIFLASALEKTGGNLTSYEHSQESIKEAQENKKKFSLKNWNIVEGDALFLLEKETQVFDMVFIDAMKKHTLSFFQKSLPLLSSSPLIVVDDVIKFAHKMEDFLSCIQTQKEFSSFVLPVDSDDGILFAWKPSSFL